MAGRGAPSCCKDAVAAFRSAMAAAGWITHGKIIADGTLHRIKANGDKTTNSWYILHVDGLPAGEFWLLETRNPRNLVRQVR